MAKNLVIVGTGPFAEIAYEYFTYDSNYEVVGFTANKDYIDKNELMDLPVVAFEEVEKKFSPSEHSAFVAVTYGQLNRVRTRMLGEAKQKGYAIASYVSSRAFVWRNVQMGENCFIFENNVIQPFVKVGSNVIMWSGNHIGHHSTIGDNCFISSHVVISGFVNVGRNCFMGVNSTVANNLEIAEDNWIGPDVSVMKSTPKGAFYKPNKFLPDEKRNAYTFCGIEEK